MKFIKIKSYAKVNLSLNILGKLTSKLHKIESIVSFLDLHDEIYLKIIKSCDHQISFYGSFSKGISKKNTISKLLYALDKKKLLNNQKFEIRIKKNIPQQSGMGGGSMNASSIISFFLKKKIIKLKDRKLKNLSNSIGSDVILGANKKNKVLFSNGKLKIFDKKLNFHVLVAKPNFGCSTKQIFSRVIEYSKPLYNKPNKSLLNRDIIINSSNDLEKIVFQKYSKFRKLKSFLLKLPNSLFIRMTGSGSSIVVYFQSKKAAVRGSKLFKKKLKSYWCIVSKTI